MKNKKKNDEKWMQSAVEKEGSLKNLLIKDGYLDSKEDKIEDIPNKDIKEFIQNHGRKIEQKLIAYANMVGSKGKKDEKERILKIVRNTKHG